VAPSLGVDLISITLQDDRQIEEVVTAFARSPNAGLIATRTGAAISRRDLIVSLAVRLHLPAVYPLRLFVTTGGLAAYGPDIADEYRHAASYVDRILKGEKPADLPVQAPTKYELVINIKAAKALNLELPPTVLARADEVIE
jgi:putative tryptophan/tyrosine transport system substrate-binding protein